MECHKIEGKVALAVVQSQFIQITDRYLEGQDVAGAYAFVRNLDIDELDLRGTCLLYTSDAADD